MGTGAVVTSIIDQCCFYYEAWVRVLLVVLHNTYFAILLGNIVISGTVLKQVCKLNMSDL